MAVSFASRYNLDLLEDAYRRWQNDPESVSRDFASFFEGFELGLVGVSRNGHAGANGLAEGDRGGIADGTWQSKVDAMVQRYRSLGHTISDLDPLLMEKRVNQHLTLSAQGLEERDLERTAASPTFAGGKTMTLREMIAQLESIYCRTIGFEFMQVRNPEVRQWLQERIEAWPRWQPSPELQLRVLRQLFSGERFEQFLHKHYRSQKRFSIEGGDTLMVALYTVLETSPENGIEEIAIGMAHRGRIAVLVEFVQKSVGVILAKFSENFIPDTVGGDGDVKYHLGYCTTRKAREGSDHEVTVRLASNPSHLEAVNPVVLGTVRARQRLLGDTEQRTKVVPVLVHGDAALAGQGIVAETLNMSQLPGYTVGGTVHFVVNNQIGFTTMPDDARSSDYCTDVAKMIEAPVFHVNGDDAEAVRFVTELAVEFRQRWKRDVFVDIVCYRRHGHNEGDEPVYTQPIMYRGIATHPTPATVYANRLKAVGVLTAEVEAAMRLEFDSRYEQVLAEVKQAELNDALSKFDEANATFQPKFDFAPTTTAISRETLDRVCQALTTFPESFHLVEKLRNLFVKPRLEAWKNGGPFNWAYAEALAFGSLLLEGSSIRLSGQDSRRGTFTQRHSYFYDERTRERFCPLDSLASPEARLCIYNSPLSEASVLGFDYGYELNFPNMLCMWEAQFGDFANGAQVIIDQFLSSAESKWQRVSGLVLLLPHGYEGQGPEHSSARLERFLQLCAEENIQVCNLTTPAQYFHLLRRQLHRPFKKPLVLMTPKSLLRHPKCVSTADDFLNGRFHEAMDSPLLGPPEKIKRVIFCSGKVYYDLLEFREAEHIATAAIVRIEQLYPFHSAGVREIVRQFPNVDRYVWCQEEPQNMGAWGFIAPLLRDLWAEEHELNPRRIEVRYAGRDAGASPAVGATTVHKKEQAALIKEAFTVGTPLSKPVIPNE